MEHFTSITFQNFKAFKRFSVSLKHFNILVMFIVYHLTFGFVFIPILTAQNGGPFKNIKQIFSIIHKIDLN